MYALIISIIIILAVLLILVILAQNPKGGGLSSQFTGGGSQLMGVKRTTDLLEKLTWGFAIAILALSISVNLFLPGQGNGAINSTNLDRAQERPVLPNSFGTETPATQGQEGTSTPAEGSQNNELLQDLTEEE